MSVQLEQELDQLRAAHQAALRLSSLLEVDPLLYELSVMMTEVLPCQRAVILLMDKYSAALEYGSHHPPLSDRSKQTALEMIFINTFSAGRDAAIQLVNRRRPGSLSTEQLAGTRLEMLTRLIGANHVHLFPLSIQNDLLGVLLIQPRDANGLSEQHIGIASSILEIAVRYLYNARHHTQTVHELSTSVYEMNILQQIDAELNDTIELSYVFRIIMDWALRFTNADLASLGLFDDAHETLTITAQYGYDDKIIQPGIPMGKERGSIALRVARSGQAEIIPDVTLDKDYYELAPGIRAHLSVPILREEKVIAVLSLESRKLNGFTENHLNFVHSLARRAGVAVDNARLFTETRREREKLALILRNIADIVLVLDNEQRIILLNYSAAIAMRLSTEIDYSGRRLTELVDDTKVKLFFQNLQMHDSDAKEELQLPNGRTYHIVMNRQRSIGWLIVMQDITQFKEAENVKNELMATVSHDLKQPLSVMRGYLDLLQMTNDFDERSRRYMESLDYAFYTMRQLIDDLLDMARIEAGLELDLEPVNLKMILMACIELLQQQAKNKSQTIKLDIPDTILPINADPPRLRQIFTNLIGNAIKYTPPHGEIRIYAHIQPDTITICVQDNGIGISPEDQSHVFDRFYRVRSSETERIEGTGLGLAIVKSLVEAHTGIIDVVSQKGKGSTFRVKLPLTLKAKQAQPA
jgi:signal transduction histidine kinase